MRIPLLPFRKGVRFQRTWNRKTKQILEREDKEMTKGKNVLTGLLVFLLTLTGLSVCRMEVSAENSWGGICMM